MKRNNAPVSDEQLNALLDGELDTETQANILASIRQDKDLAAIYCDLRQLKEMVALAYFDPPQPKNAPYPRFARRPTHGFKAAFATIALLFVGGLSGWFVNTLTTPVYSGDPDLSFQTIAELDPKTLNSTKVLLHINSKDDARVRSVLDTTERLLNSARSAHKKLELEVVANAEGLDILRDGSPYASRIHNIASQYDNVSFMACGIAKQSAALKEGKEIKLIPDAQDIPAALEQILKRLKGGWLYVRG